MHDFSHSKQLQAKSDSTSNEDTMNLEQRELNPKAKILLADLMRRSYKRPQDFRSDYVDDDY